MFDNLRSILNRLEMDCLIWAYAEVEQWGEGQFEQCLASELFASAETSTRIACTECGEITDVYLPDERSATGLALLPCGECGPHRVPLQVVSCWRLNFSLFLDRLSVAMQVAGEREEVVKGRVWRLGKSHLAGASRNVYFARSLHRRDAREVIERASFPAGSLVLVPSDRPAPEYRIEPLPVIVRLKEVLEWKGHGFLIDRQQVEGALAAVRASRAEKVKRPTSKRRLQIIGELKRELMDHLRAARDHALATRQATGKAELLPRPTQELLAKQLNIHRTSVSRCFDHETAGELRYLWTLAADLDTILAHSM